MDRKAFVLGRSRPLPIWVRAAIPRHLPRLLRQLGGSRDGADVEEGRSVRRFPMQGGLDLLEHGRHQVGRNGRGRTAPDQGGQKCPPHGASLQEWEPRQELPRVYGQEQLVRRLRLHIRRLGFP